MRVSVVAALDAVLVVLFVVIGRFNHAEGLAPKGLAQTAWPFLLATAVGWAFAYVLTAIRAHEPAADRPFAPAHVFPEGIIIWVSTVAVGMTARGLLTTAGVEVSFVIVATIALGVFLVGWRVIASVVARRRSSATTVSR